MKGIIKDILIAVAIVLVITFFIRPTIVKEQSMLPTLEPEDYLVMSKQSYTFGEIQRGDIIIFESELRDEKGKQKLLIKRVIGIPGDTIEMADSKVIINGEVANEPYVLDQNQSGDMEKITISEGKVFAMGDNREVSHDSRAKDIGLVDMKDIKGEAIFRLYPFDKLGKI